MKKFNLIILSITVSIFMSCSSDDPLDDKFLESEKEQNQIKETEKLSLNRDCYYLAALVEGQTCFSSNNVPGYQYTAYANAGNIEDFDRVVNIAVVKPDEQAIIDGGSVTIPAGQVVSNNIPMFNNINEYSVGDVEVWVTGVRNLSNGQTIPETSDCEWRKTTYPVNNCYNEPPSENPGIEITPCNGAIGIGPDDNDDCKD